MFLLSIFHPTTLGHHKDIQMIEEIALMLTD